MGYSSERASKSSHHHLINSPQIQEALKVLDMLPRAEEALSVKGKITPFMPDKNSKISKFITIDGAFAEVKIRSEFPLPKCIFFNLGH